MKWIGALLAFSVVLPSSGLADQWGLERGSVNLKSVSSMTFGPDGILFVGDARAATVYALRTGDKKGESGRADINVDQVEARIADATGSPGLVSDLAVNPATQNVFIAVQKESSAQILKVQEDGTLQALELSDIPHSEAQLVDAPEDKVVQQGRRRRNPRDDAITDLAFYENKLLISGLRDGASASSVRELNFPFAKADRGVGVQIFHAAHGRDEDYSAARTIVPLVIDGKPNLLAAYVCTPLVKIPLEALESAEEKITATTVAELGNRNRPLDMISYSKEGQQFLLLSNSARGVMKIQTSGLSANAGLTEPVRGGGTAGQEYKTVESLQGVTQMDKLNSDHAVVLIENQGQLTLKSVALP